MNETIRIGELSIKVTRKGIKHVHLSVHPPDGRVTLAVPASTRLDAAALTPSANSAGYANSKTS